MIKINKEYNNMKDEKKYDINKLITVMPPSWSDVNPRSMKEALTAWNNNREFAHSTGPVTTKNEVDALGIIVQIRYRDLKYISPYILPSPDGPSKYHNEDIFKLIK